MILLTVLFMVFATFIGAVGSLFLKKGSSRFHVSFNFDFFKRLFKNGFVILGVFLYGLSSIIFIYLLRSNDLSVLYPLTSLTYIFVTILSVYFLGERMNLYKWLGISLIILGVIFVTV